MLSCDSMRWFRGPSVHLHNDYFFVIRICSCRRLFMKHLYFNDTHALDYAIVWFALMRLSVIATRAHTKTRLDGGTNAVLTMIALLFEFGERSSKTSRAPFHTRFLDGQINAEKLYLADDKRSHHFDCSLCTWAREFWCGGILVRNVCLCFETNAWTPTVSTCLYCPQLRNPDSSMGACLCQFYMNNVICLNLTYFICPFLCWHHVSDVSASDSFNLSDHPFWTQPTIEIVSMLTSWDFNLVAQSFLQAPKLPPRARRLQKAADH